MTTTTETKEAPKKKGSKPTHEIFPVNAEGKPDYKARIGYWQHGKGGGGICDIGVLLEILAWFGPDYGLNAAKTP